MDKSPKVLLVDDDELLREAVGAAIRWAGMRVESLETPGQDFVQKVETLMPDIILLDLYIRDISGLDVCRQLKRNPKTKEIPVILFTSSTEKIDRIAGEDAGAVEYVVKPIDVNLLLSKIKSHLKND
jgi:DNA-binding response OmpR family regulator